MSKENNIKKEMSKKSNIKKKMSKNIGQNVKKSICQKPGQSQPIASFYRELSTSRQISEDINNPFGEYRSF